MAFSFNPLEEPVGTDDVHVSSGPFVTTGSAWTIAIWIFVPSGQTTAQGHLITEGDGSFSDITLLTARANVASPDAFSGLFIDGSFRILQAGATSIFADKWTHLLAVQRSTTDRELFADGVSLGTNFDSIVSPTRTEFTIGASRVPGPGFEYSGGVGPVALWDVGLNSSERAELVLGVDPQLVRSSSLKRYLSMEALPQLDSWNGNLLVRGTILPFASSPLIYRPSSEFLFTKPSVPGIVASRIIESTVTCRVVDTETISCRVVDAKTI